MVSAKLFLFSRPLVIWNLQSNLKIAFKMQPKVEKQRYFENRVFDKKLNTYVFNRFYLSRTCKGTNTHL